MNLLVLGAGTYQLPAIVRAKELGHKVVVCTRAGDYPGLAHADTVHLVDTTDLDACIEVARSERIQGVLSPGTDVSIPTLGAIADSLGLSGPTRKAAVLAADKQTMKEAFVAHGIPTPRSSAVASIDEAFRAADEIGYPVMVKVIDSSGSRGVLRVDAAPDLPSAFDACMAQTRSNVLLVEQYVDGEEFGAQAFVSDGELLFVMPHGDTVRKTDVATVPVGHHVPYETPSIPRRRIESVAKATVSALGLDNCALNFDFMAREGELFVIEVGARSGATCLSEIVSAHYDIDYYGFMVRHALGERPTAVFKPGPAVAATLLTSGTAGTIRSLPEFPPDNDIVDIRFDIGIGDDVRKFQVGPDRIGHMVVANDDLATALERIAELEVALSPSIDPK